MKENRNRVIDRQIKVTIPLLNLVSLANHDITPSLFSWTERPR